jgi:hypothetical protein
MGIMSINKEEARAAIGFCLCLFFKVLDPRESDLAVSPSFLGICEPIMQLAMYIIRA